MPNLNSFLAGTDFSSLVPEEYQVYCPVIRDGLTFFLSQLPEGRTLNILAEQLGMPKNISLEERLVAIARHSPVLHKLGQVIAHDRRLSVTFRQLLQTLESIELSVELETIQTALEAELGHSLPTLGITLLELPVAEASVAIVVPFNGRSPDGQPLRGVFKLLKPKIENTLAEDLHLLQQLGALLDERCYKYRLPAIQYQASFTQVQKLLSLEVQLGQEQANLEKAVKIYKDVPSVIVPQPYLWLSTPRVTAMERIEGVKVTDIRQKSVAQRFDLCTTIINALITRPIWSVEQDMMFHADPHAGNLLITPDERLAILDWSLVGFLSKQDREQLMQLMIGEIASEAGRIGHTIASLVKGKGDKNTPINIIKGDLHSFSAEEKFSPESVRLADEASINEVQARFSTDLVMFHKAVYILKGVVTDICEDFPFEMALVSSFLSQFVGELSVRAFSMPFSRSFSTHLSNADIAYLLMMMPLVMSQHWLRFIQQVYLSEKHDNSDKSSNT